MFNVRIIWMWIFEVDLVYSDENKITWFWQNEKKKIFWATNRQYFLFIILTVGFFRTKMFNCAPREIMRIQPENELNLFRFSNKLWIVHQQTFRAKKANELKKKIVNVSVFFHF